MSISERETQPKKALFLIAETELGIETDLRDVQREKASLGTEAMPEPIEAELRALQLIKQPEPRLVTESGTETEVRDEQPEKA